jgi:hypothetical protein
MTKKISFILAMFMLTMGWTYGQIDQSTPQSALEAVFKAAKTGNTDGLASLCDPDGENDGDTECICAFDGAYSRNRCREQFPQKEFKAAFQDAKISGEAMLTHQEGVELAEVPFLFGPGATRKEVMRLVKRGEKWYLLSF